MQAEPPSSSSSSSSSSLSSSPLKPKHSTPHHTQTEPNRTNPPRYFLHIQEVLSGGGEAGVNLGYMWAWSAEWNNEYMRMLAGSLVAAANLAVVAQDWDFPNFSDTVHV